MKNYIEREIAFKELTQNILNSQIKRLCINIEKLEKLNNKLVFLKNIFTTLK